MSDMTSIKNVKSVVIVMSDPMADPMALDLWHLAQRDSKGQILVITDLGYRIADMIEI